MPDVRSLPWRRIGLVALLDLGAPVVLSIATVHELTYDGSPILKWVVSLALVWVLVLRRRFPVAVFAAAVVLAVVVLVWSPTVAELAVLVALYTVAAHRSFRTAIVAALVLEVGVVVIAFRIAPARSVNDYLVVLSGVAAAALFLGTTLRGNRRYLAATEDRAARLELERQQQAELAAADERARIAREMHDIVAHGLAVVITLSEGAAKTAERDPSRAAAAMHQVADAGRESLDEMRRLLHVLRTDDGDDDGGNGNGNGGGGPRAPQPGLAMLPRVLDDVRAAGIAVEASIDVPTTISSGADAAVFRIVQEALTNVMKHADAPTTVRVAVADEAGTVRFEVHDDGHDRGATSTTEGTMPGNGLRGMRERVAMFGGTVRAGRTGQGWTVSGTVPDGSVPDGTVPDNAAHDTAAGGRP